MIAGQSASGQTSGPIPLNNTFRHWNGAVFAAGVTSGTVIIETGPSMNGPWTLAATIDAATGAQEYRADGPGGFIRHRIGTTIAGGASPSVNTYCNRIHVGDV